MMSWFRRRDDLGLGNDGWRGNGGRHAWGWCCRKGYRPWRGGGELATREDGAIGFPREINQGTGEGRSSWLWAVRGGGMPDTIMVVAEENGTSMAEGRLRCSWVRHGHGRG